MTKEEKDNLLDQVIAIQGEIFQISEILTWRVEELGKYGKEIAERLAKIDQINQKLVYLAFPELKEETDIPKFSS